MEIVLRGQKAPIAGRPTSISVSKNGKKKGGGFVGECICVRGFGREDWAEAIRSRFQQTANIRMHGVGHIRTYKRRPKTVLGIVVIHLNY